MRNTLAASWAALETVLETAYREMLYPRRSIPDRCGFMPRSSLKSASAKDDEISLGSLLKRFYRFIK